MRLLPRAHRTDDDQRRWDEVLRDLIEDHISNEQEALLAYEEGIHSVDDEGVRYLLRGILDDERRHHQRLSELAASVDHLVSGSPRLREMPTMHPWRTADDLLQVTEELLQVERDDARELTSLSEQLRDTRWSSVWWITVEQLRFDTDKHIATLEYLRDLALRNRSLAES